jgi:HPt (histidine-containing phosphotransfer) domain-containing protein
VEAGDATEVREIAHKLKGAVGNLSSRPTYEAAFALEKAGEQGDLSKCAADLAELTELTQELLSELVTMTNLELPE